MLFSLAFVWPAWAVGLATLLFVLVSVVLVLTVLIQKPQGGGLSGAFGSGAGSGQTAFGTKTGDALTVATIIIFGVYLLLGVTLVFAYRPQSAPSIKPAGGTPTAPAGATTPAGEQAPPADTTPPTSPATGGDGEAEPSKPADAPAGASPAGATPTTPPSGTPAPSDQPAPAPAPK